MPATEAQTRKEIIDLKLRDAGWDVGDCTQVVQEFGIRREASAEVREAQAAYGTQEFSDYVLLGRDGKPLAVVEAKKSSRDAEVGREQAKQYCSHIQQQYGGKLPFCFYTNGHEIFFWNIGHYPPKRVFGFPSRDDLERYQYIRDHKKPLARELINTNIAGRDYQLQAIRSVMEALEKKQRTFLSAGDGDRNRQNQNHNCAGGRLNASRMGGTGLVSGGSDRVAGTGFGSL